MKYLTTILLALCLNSNAQTVWHLTNNPSGTYSKNSFITLNPQGDGYMSVEGCKLYIKYYCTPHHVIFLDTLTHIYYTVKVKEVNEKEMVLFFKDVKLKYERYENTVGDDPTQIEATIPEQSKKKGNQ